MSAIAPLAQKKRRSNRPERLDRRTRAALGFGTVVGLLLLWEAGSTSGMLPKASFPSASAVLVALFQQLGTFSFWVALWNTLASAMIGLAIVLLIATPLALLIGLSRNVQESVWVVLEFLKPIPPVALIPLGLLLWGPSPTMKLFLIVFGALWPLLTQMVYGVREVNGVAMDMAKSYRLGSRLTISRIVIPSLLPFTATGLRVSASIAVIIAIVTELIAGATGLGQNITLAQNANDLPVMYALIVAAGLLGLTINETFKAGERFALFWHVSQRGEGTS